MAVNMDKGLYRRRQIANSLGMATSLVAMALGLTVLLWILLVLFSNGFAALDWDMLTKDTPAPMAGVCAMRLWAA
jgi:phosphate transport system permease protein